MEKWDRNAPDAAIRVETDAEKREREVLRMGGFGNGTVLHYTDTVTTFERRTPTVRVRGAYKCLPSFELADGLTRTTKQITTDESLLQLLDAAYRIGEAD